MQISHRLFHEASRFVSLLMQRITASCRAIEVDAEIDALALLRHTAKTTQLEHHGIGSDAVLRACDHAARSELRHVMQTLPYLEQRLGRSWERMQRLARRRGRAGGPQQ